MSQHITIFDTTLRDGEQSPGCSMTTPEKLEVAKALVELGVDVIEAGFPIASPGDFDAVRQIANTFGDQTTICGLARCRVEDIDRAWEALQGAKNVRIHVFLATSAIHREFKLKMAKEEIVRRAVEMVKYTASKMSSRSDITVPNIEFSPKMPRGQSSTSSRKWSRRRSTPGPRRSTSRTRSGMRHPITISR